MGDVSVLQSSLAAWLDSNRNTATRMDEIDTGGQLVVNTHTKSSIVP